ncbi:MAG: MFS transporter [Acidobacteria bacterium]|nr:MFS transporter [Acidobacteriota bacterium]
MIQGLRWRLSVMMFLQYSIWGAWYPVFSDYLDQLGYSGTQTGWIYSLLNLACMLAPFTAGQLADRYFATEKLLGVLHLIGGVVFLFAATVTDFSKLWPLMLGWAIVYAPTLALTNSLCFHHMPEAEKQFGLIRVWGTIGWIIVGFCLSGLRKTGLIDGLGGSDSLWVGAVMSFVLAAFSLVLPHTPPARTGDNPWAFLSAFKLMRDPQFAIFIIVSFVVSTELMFFYVLTAPFLKTIGVSKEAMPLIMSIAQIAEIVAMLALPLMLAKWGIRKTMVIGILAWPLRYAIFAYGEPRSLVIASLVLHGFCYVCFFVVSQIYVNEVAGPDIRASAQGLITFATLGAGLYVGSLFAGFVKDFYTVGDYVSYGKIFTVPLVLTLLCAVVFTLTFRDRGVSKVEAQPAS